MFSIVKGKEMTKETNPWGDEASSSAAIPAKTKTKLEKPAAPVAELVGEYDIDGLMTDFPTAKDLERFVFDEVGVVLNLKGRANKLKYQVAMDVLNGQEIDPKFIGNENPYLDKNDMVPVEELKKTPARDQSLPPSSEEQNSFYSPFVPHPHPDFRARGKKCHCLFRKYKDGSISYEILGPLDQVEHGSKIDKYGRTRPEIIKWVDPRTGEQTVMRDDGTLTQIGRRLRSMMQTQRVNNTSAWELWIDREFGSMNRDAISNPWDLEGKK
jgi:hypothetical protein|tara:strand:- start:3104 stop:3910 length:807 start_codon:yes stop_codon:yes gene_type:complete